MKKTVRKTSPKKSSKAVSKPAKKSSPKQSTTKRKYEGASKSKRLSRWHASSTSPNAEVSGGLINLRNRSRDLRRNNPYAARAIQAIGANVVGDGIMTRFSSPNDTAGKKSKLEKLWDSWAYSTDIDFDGQHDICSLQLLIMEAVAESGEVLVRKRFDSSKAFPLQYQVLESDFLDMNANAVSGSTNTVIQGIEFDKKGRRVAYHLFEQHPGGYEHQMYSPLKSNRVPAEDVMHIFRMDRPGQARGIPWLSPVIVRLKDFDDFEDAQLVRQKIAACFTAFVHDLSAEVMGDNEDADVDELGSRIEPAMIEHLPAGKTVTFANPPGVQNYKEYTTTVLHGIAVGVGLTYEVLTNDYSLVNFSSGRMGWIEMNRNLKVWRQNIIQLKFLEPLVKDFKKAAAILGVDSKEYTHTHIPPKREMIDPTKEIPAAIMAIKGGLSTLSEEIMAQGKDAKEHLEQYKQDMDTIDKLKIKVISDARLPPEPGRPTGSGGLKE